MIGAISAAGTEWAAAASTGRRDRRPDDRTIFRLASLSKAFTATALASAVTTGDIALDEPVLHHITYRHLATHTAGLTREAALACARVGLPHAVGAARFGVSADVMQWRTDSSGAARRAQAEARKQGRTIPRLATADIATLVTELDLAWLSDLNAPQWRGLLRNCGQGLASGWTDGLAQCLEPPIAEAAAG